MEIENKPESNNLHKNKAHRILAHSYSMYLVLFLVGVTLDLIFPFEFFSNEVLVQSGIVLLVFSSVLILSAQIATRNIPSGDVSKETFAKGPYRYARHPTHWGLFFLTIGFGILANAVFVILSTLISFLLARFVFLTKQERVLADKYGAPYLEYKKSVKI